MKTKHTSVTPYLDPMAAYQEQARRDEQLGARLAVVVRELREEREAVTMDKPGQGRVIALLRGIARRVVRKTEKRGGV